MTRPARGGAGHRASAAARQAIWSTRVPWPGGSAALTGSVAASRGSFGGGGGLVSAAGFETGVDDTLEMLLIIDPRRFVSVTDDSRVRSCLLCGQDRAVIGCSEHVCAR